AEDGIRDRTVTGVQTCALPISGAVLENISFTNVHVTYEGGGTAEESARRDVPQIAGEYFEIGTPPAYGVYARGVRGLTLDNVRRSEERRVGKGCRCRRGGGQ